MKNANDEIKEFLYVISHDFNAPLRHIREFTKILIQSLEKKDALSDKEKLYAKFIQEGVSEAENMLESLLQLSRINTKQSKIEDVNLSEIILKQLKKFVKNNSENNINITKNLDSNIKIKIDKRHISRVLKELLDNSLKFRDNNESLEIVISLTEDKDNNLALFSLKDNGIGEINDKFKEDIFRIFRKLHPKDEFEGSGSGLTIARKIIEKYNGRIWLEDSDENGSEFKFTLPLAK